MTPRRPQKRDRCRSCGRVPDAWLPAAPPLQATMFLHHLGTMHPAEVGPYLVRIATEGIATVAAEAYEVIEVESPGAVGP